MRSYLLKSMASVVAMLAVLAFVAGGAMAQPKISGGAAAGFGQVSWDLGGTGQNQDGSGFNAQIESNVILSGTNDNMDYYFRMRARGTQGSTIVKDFSEGTFNGGQMQTVRVRVGWNVTDTFRLEVGRLPGIGGTGFADKRPLRAPGGFRHPVNNVAMFDAGAINASFKTGGIRVGLAISANCQADCEYGGQITGTTGTARGASIAAEQTILPYFQGSFGPAKVGFRMAMSEASISDTNADPALKIDDKVEGEVMVLEVAFNFGQGEAALEYTASTSSSPVTGEKDVDATAIGLAFSMGGILVQYSMAEVALDVPGEKNPETTLVSASYLFDVGGGQVGPEIAMATDNPGGVAPIAEEEGTLIRIIMKTGF